MNLSYLNEKDWDEFRKNYPDAESFLLEKSIENEFKLLKHLDARNLTNEWEKNRLNELQNIYSIEAEYREVTA